MRDYFDFINMTPAELAAYACDVAGNDLMLALAHQLETQARLAAEAEHLREDYNALQRQMNRTYG